MADQQVPSIGRVVHFVYGGEHYAAIITAVSSRLIEGDGEPQYGQTLVVFPPMDMSFTTVAALDPDCALATWHWPEYVPAVKAE